MSFSSVASQQGAGHARLSATQYAALQGGPFVKIVVGQEAKIFTLSKPMLAYASPYFDRAFNGKFDEAGTGVVVLAHATVRAFELAIAFIFNFENRFLKYDVKDFETEEYFITAMIELSALSQHLLMPSLDKCAVTNLKTLLDTNSTSLTCRHIFLAFEVLNDKSDTRDTLVRTTLKHFLWNGWDVCTRDVCTRDVCTRDIFQDWKFSAATAIPGYMSALLVLMKDHAMGRFRG